MTTTQDVPQSGVNRTLIAILIGAGLAIIVAALAFVRFNSDVGTTSEAAPAAPEVTPEELAEEYINANPSMFSEYNTEFMATNHWILQRLDAEYLRNQVQSSTRWQYMPARPLGGDVYEMSAVAYVNIAVDSPWTSGNAEAIVPFVLTISLNNRQVTASAPDYANARFETNLPSIEESLDDIAKRYINDKIDAMSEHIVLFIVGGNWLLKELGGEYVEDRIHDVIKWEYQPSSPLGGDKYEVVAVAHVEFSVDIPTGAASVEAGLPFTLTIDLSARAVEKMDPEFLSAYFKTDIPDVASIDVTVDEMVDFAKGNTDAAKEAAVEASDAVKESADEAADAAKEAIDTAKDKATDAVKDTNCIEAARDAGVPETILELIQKPKDERSGIENSILRRGLDAVGLSDACADVE